MGHGWVTPAWSSALHITSKTLLVIAASRCPLYSVKYHRDPKGNPHHQEVCCTKSGEQGMDIAFLEHLLCAKHYVRCFVSFGLKRIAEPRRVLWPTCNWWKKLARKSWSPDLYLGLVVSKSTAGFEATVEDRRSGFPTLWKYLKGDSPGSEISHRAPEAALRCHVASWMDRCGYRRDCAYTQRGILGTFTWSPSKFSSQPVSKTEPHTQVSVIAGFSFRKFLGIDDDSLLWQRCLLAQ